MCKARLRLHLISTSRRITPLSLFAGPRKAVRRSTTATLCSDPWGRAESGADDAGATLGLGRTLLEFRLGRTTYFVNLRNAVFAAKYGLDNRAGGKSEARRAGGSDATEKSALRKGAAAGALAIRAPTPRVPFPVEPAPSSPASPVPALAPPVGPARPPAWATAGSCANGGSTVQQHSRAAGSVRRLADHRRGRWLRPAPFLCRMDATVPPLVTDEVGPNAYLALLSAPDAAG